MLRPKFSRHGVAVMLILLTGCGNGLITNVGPDYQTPALPTAPHWQTAQPAIAHDGDLALLQHWWQRFDDPVLSQFLTAAQQVNANVAEASSRIQQARAGAIGAEAAGIPAIDGNLAATRSSFSFGGPPFLRNQYQIGLQANWEVDLFGSVARQREAAQSQLESRVAAWHDARVAVAAEVANAYLDYRQCEVLVKLVEADALSRQHTARLTAIVGRAGLRAQADVDLAQASAADGQHTLLGQQGQCERDIKGLVALTGLQEPEVRQQLTFPAERVARLPKPPVFTLAALPAKVLMQRPDVAAAERDVAEASATIGAELAKRYPRLSLSGNITPLFQNINGSALVLAQTWSIGPSLSLPIFDAGKRAADVEAAEAKYTAGVARFQATVRTAAKEVEEALVRLHTAEERMPLARSAVTGYSASFNATEQRYRVGFGSLLDTEVSRRQKLAAERVLAELEQEQAAAWIALYRAAGGGWEDSNPAQPQSANSFKDDAS